MIAALCRCAAEGGAAGVRVDGAPVVRAVAAATGLPVIGLEKAWGTGHGLSEGRPAITPTVGAAVSLASAGAAIVAVEATRELHGDGAAAYVRAVRRELAGVLMADVSTLAEGLAAYDAGADLVSTTLSGYTVDSGPRLGPDLQLVADLAGRGVPTVAEGRICSPEAARRALEKGAVFVVVGKAITDPLFLAAEYVAALARGREVVPGPGCG
jgi:N-acylglucosamine-6-phosphate 2-epimerase